MSLSLLGKFEDFSGGHWGSGQSWISAPDGTFGGVNVMRYANGLLGPRPSFVLLREFPVTGFPTLNPFLPSSNEGPTPFLVTSTQVWGDFTDPLSPGVSFAPTAALWLSATRFLYSSAAGATIGSWVRSGANTTSPLPSTFGGDLIQYGSARIAYRFGRFVYFSGAGTPMTWPTGGSSLFTAVGDDGPILRLYPHRDGAIAHKESGVFFVSGDPEDGSLSVRRMTSPPSLDGIRVSFSQRGFYSFEDGAAFGVRLTTEDLS